MTRRKTTTMFAVRRILLAVIALQTVSALDIYLRSYDCDRTLPIYADRFVMWCGDSEDEKTDKCSFGEVATFEGDMVYEEVENSGVQDNAIWSKADLKFLSLSYHLFEDYQLDLCHEVVTSEEMDENQEEADGGEQDEENANQCPADGLYSYSVTYMLPETENSAASWLATGWAGSGKLEFFSAEGSSESNLIGTCTFEIGTDVTTNGAKLHPPTAATTSGMLIGLFALLMLACFYCACCRPNASRKPKDHDATRSLMENESVLTPNTHRGKAINVPRGGDAPTVDGSITHPATTSQGETVQIY